MLVSVCADFLEGCDQDFVQPDKRTRLLVSKRLQVIFILFNKKKCIGQLNSMY